MRFECPCCGHKLSATNRTNIEREKDDYTKTRAYAFCGHCGAAAIIEAHATVTEKQAKDSGIDITKPEGEKEECQLD